jgi:hypothetical protein
MVMELTNIIGLTQKAANLLIKAGIKQCEDLVGLTASELKSLCVKTGIELGLLDEWQEHADLMRIEGVGPEEANALNDIGIDSVKEFARRNPMVVYYKLKTFSEENEDLEIKVPSADQCKKWVANAQGLAKIPDGKPEKEKIKPDKEQIVEEADAEVEEVGTEEQPEESESSEETETEEITEDDIILTDDEEEDAEEKEGEDEADVVEELADELSKKGKKDIVKEQPNGLPAYIEIPTFDADYGKYGPDFWNSKWPKSSIIYTGRYLFGKKSKTQIDADCKSFIKKDDEILKVIINEYKLRKKTPNATAWACQQFVCEFLKYVLDDKIAKAAEFWQFPFESIQAGEGDCEDGAILMIALMINAGIPSWRCKVCAGQALVDPLANAIPFVQKDPNAAVGGHGWPAFLADRPESPRKLEWVIMDWCYLQDPEIPPEKKPLSNDGGTYGAYKEIWFTFNDEYSWAQSPITVKATRISKNRTMKKEDVINESIEDMVTDIFKDMNVVIEENKETNLKKKKF